MNDFSQFADDSPHSVDDPGTADALQSPAFLQRLSSWVRRMRTCGRMLIAVGVVASGATILRLLDAVSQRGSNGFRAGLLVGLMIVGAIVVVTFVVPGVCLIQAARHTEHYLRTDDQEELFSGFRILGRFWLVVGIVATTIILLIVLMVASVAMTPRLSR